MSEGSSPKRDETAPDIARTETALRESEERFLNVVQGAPDGVAILRGPVITYLNPRAARMLGLATPEAGYGRPITDFLHPDDVPLAVSRIRTLLETGKAHDGAFEYRSRSIEGRSLTVEISSILIEFEGQRAVLAFARDVTDRKAMQTRLAQADRLSALGVLSAGVAHEINNPLAYVLLNLEYIERELARLVERGEPQPLLQRVREAQHGAERVATIVRDLRTFTRDDDGTRGPVSVEARVEAALNIVGAELKRRARLVKRYEDVPPVEGNDGRLEQVFVNLLMNAAQSLPPDATPTAHAVTITVAQSGEDVRVSVHDTGSGMSEEVKGRIFDPFFTTKPPGVGTGLGLPICQGIVRAHGGSIEVESELGRGSTFHVTLPIFRGKRDADAAPANAPAAVELRGRVLIVDDDVAVGRTLSLVLETDHDVTVVTSGQEALAELRAAQRIGGFDAVLCDVLMPGMTGGELFDLVRVELPAMEPRFIFMSGGLFMHGAAEFARKVSRRLLEKPFNLEHVRGALREVVALSRASGKPGWRSLEQGRPTSGG